MVKRRREGPRSLHSPADSQDIFSTGGPHLGHSRAFLVRTVEDDLPLDVDAPRGSHSKASHEFFVDKEGIAKLERTGSGLM